MLAFNGTSAYAFASLRMDLLETMLDRLKIERKDLVAASFTEITVQAEDDQRLLEYLSRTIEALERIIKGGGVR